MGLEREQGAGQACPGSLGHAGPAGATEGSQALR